MTFQNSLRFLTGGAAVLSLALVSTLPVNAEIAKRNVYRDATITRVDAGSTAEFAKLYNAGQAKAASDGSAAKGGNGSPKPAMGSNEFGPRLHQSNEFGPRAFASNEFGPRAFASNEFGPRAFLSNE